MARTKNTYQKAYNELQSIVEKIQNEEIGLDDLGAQIKKATELINMCKEKLRTIEKDINEHLGD